MQSLRQNIRIWWRPPRNISDRETERSVTFLELFYDLVYVILIAELAHTLSKHVNLGGVLGFAFLFVIVWIAWVNGTMYHELHGNNDIRTRVFTFLQMLTVAMKLLSMIILKKYWMIWTIVNWKNFYNQVNSCGNGEI